MRGRKDAYVGIAGPDISSRGLQGWLEPMPTGSKKDTSLAKARLISDGGSASGIMHLRGQKACPNSNCTRTVIPLKPVGKTLVSQAVPLQPMEIHAGTENQL